MLLVLGLQFQFDGVAHTSYVVVFFELVSDGVGEFPAVKLHHLFH
jgi:hypothetical protein